MSSIQYIITRYANKQESFNKKSEKSVTRIVPEITQSLELQEKYWKKKDTHKERETLKRMLTIGGKSNGKCRTEKYKIWKVHWMSLTKDRTTEEMIHRLEDGSRKTIQI